MTVAWQSSGRRRVSGLDALWAATAALSSVPLLVNVAQPGGLAPWERIAAAGVIALAAWRPLDAACLLAAFAPLGGLVSALGGSDATATLWLLPAVLAGWAVSRVAAPGNEEVRSPPAWLTAAALALAWLALTSVIVTVLRDRVWFETGEAWRQAIEAFVGSRFFVRTSAWRETTAGVLLAEQALAVPFVASLLARDTDASRLTRMLLTGATAAAAHNVIRVVLSALASGNGWTALLALAHSRRISAAFPDYNSAGPLFALTTLMAAGMAWRAVQQRRTPAAVVAGAAVALNLAALTLTGSRAAVAVIAPAVLAALLLRQQDRRRAMGKAAAALTAVALTVAMLALAQAQRAQNNAEAAVRIRLEFVASTWRMLEDHPIFGIGAGAYRQASGRYASEWLRHVYRNQNAHNNYMQVAGELGPFALVAFLVLLWGPVWRTGRAIREDRAGVVAAATWAGAVAFLLACLGSHPLLIPEVAVSAMVAFGLLAGCVEGPVEPSTSTRRRWLVPALVAAAVVLAVSAPPRARAARASLDLEHVVLGPGRWTQAHGEPELRFRGHAALYVRADGQRAMLTLRPARRPRAPIDVTLSLDGRPVNVVRLVGAEWMNVPLVVPSVAGRAFRVLRLDAHVAGEGGVPASIVMRRINRF